jgi:sulfite reductase alpha subunit-like flavoprotein
MQKKILDIFYASQSGTSEEFAEILAKESIKAKISTRVTNLKHFNVHFNCHF